jgi:hypothetical protein
MDRTPEDGQRLVLETELERLMGKVKLSPFDGGQRFGSPILILNISATLVPVFLRIHRDGKLNVGVYAVKPAVQVYSGLDNMTPCFLADKELQLRNSFWSPKVIGLYNDAHPKKLEDQREGILILDAVNPRVHVDRSIMQRAEHVCKQFPRFTVVAIWGGGGIKVKIPNRPWLTKDDGTLLDWCQDVLSIDLLDGSPDDEGVEAPASQPRPQKRRNTKKFTISQVLTAILTSQGIRAPIAVIGYSRLLRGDSFRTDPVICGGEERSIVPTHVSNSPPHSAMNTIQSHLLILLLSE